jgi:hypothetical protein
LPTKKSIDCIFFRLSLLDLRINSKVGPIRRKNKKIKIILILKTDAKKFLGFIQDFTGDSNFLEC